MPRVDRLKFLCEWPILQTMTVNSTASSPSALELQREVLVLKKAQDVAVDVSQSLIELVKSAPAPGRVDRYA